jgi:hypothetical protein
MRDDEPRPVWMSLPITHLGAKTKKYGSRTQKDRHINNTHRKEVYIGSN